MKKPQRTHGGKRTGAGRPPRQLQPGEKRYAVWIYATEREMFWIRRLTASAKKDALIGAAILIGN